MSGFHECELKVKIDNELRTELREMVVKKGYVLTDSRIETDYIMDTPETAFGKNLFRVRDMNNAEGKTILYTIKLKGTSTDFQDYTEYEITPKEDGADILARLIKSVCGVELDESIFKITNEEYIKSLIRPRIDWAGTTVVLIGKNTSKSDYVNWEIEHAASKGKRIVGVYLQGESDSEIPEALNKYGNSLQKWNGESIISGITGDNTWNGPGRNWATERVTC